VIFDDQAMWMSVGQLATLVCYDLRGERGLGVGGVLAVELAGVGMPLSFARLRRVAPLIPARFAVD